LTSVIGAQAAQEIVAVLKDIGGTGRIAKVEQAEVTL
jgi:hypothetical protein